MLNAAGHHTEETKTMALQARSAVAAFSEHCEWTGAVADEREHWLLTRREGIGGSDAAAIMGVNDYSSELSVYVDKIGKAAPDDGASEVAEWGRIFEAPIVKEYARRSERRVVRGGRLMRSLHARHHLVTLDGVQLSKPPPWARGPGVAEVKTTGYGKRYEEGVPVEVQVQIQWELAVTGAEWATCVWLPFPERRLQWLDIAPHPEFQAVLRERVDAFWERVQKRQPPDPDASEASQMALRALYPEDTEEVIRITGGCLIADEYERNKAAIALLTERQGLIKNMLAATIREAKYALLEDGRYWGTAYYPARENACKLCAGVTSKQGSYRTYTLRDPRKKPFTAPTDTRKFLLAEHDEGPGLVKALEASVAQYPANDRTAEESAQ
jgi:putative phage-type endonuclease